MMMSSTEWRTLATKAAIGAGLPPGHAQIFGAAALYHLSAGRDADTLLDALTQAPDGPLKDLPVALLKVLEAARGETAQGQIRNVWSTSLIKSYVQSQPFAVSVTYDDACVNVTFDLCTPNLWTPPRRITACSDLRAELTQLAARTLVPDSAVSRHSGAGAGLLDND